MVPVSVPEIQYNGKFFRYFTLCNNKNIYFSEKNKSKTLNFNILNNRALQFFFFFFFQKFNQMKSNENETLLFFGKQTEVCC